MKILPNFLSAADLDALDRVRGELFTARRQYTTTRGYTYVGVNPIPTAILSIYTRAHSQLVDAPVNDCFFLVYDQGQGVKRHLDAGREMRLIALVEAPEAGGELLIRGEKAPLSRGDAVVFRPGTEVHEVTPVVAGRRVVWSVGARSI